MATDVVKDVSRMKPRGLLLRAIQLSGLSKRQFANDVIFKHEMTVRKWTRPGPQPNIPEPVLAILRKIVTDGKLPFPVVPRMEVIRAQQAAARALKPPRRHTGRKITRAHRRKLSEAMKQHHAAERAAV